MNLEILPSLSLSLSSRVMTVGLDFHTCFFSTEEEVASPAGLFGFAFLLELFRGSPEEAPAVATTEEESVRILRFLGIAVEEDGAANWRKK